MPILPDGTVIPSHVGFESRGGSDATTVFGNVALRQGEVVSIVHPDDPKNYDKKAVSTRYKVAVQHQDGSGPATTVFYPHCIAISDFGGVADRTHATYRAREKDPDSGEVISNGSMVLVLCVNGDTNRAYILGGLPPASPADTQDDGHHYYFEFNGISFAINKDGEATMKFVGPTKTDGTLDTDAGASDDNGPTTVSVLKNGNLKISTKDDKQSILIDHENKKTVFTFDQEWDVQVDGKCNIKSKGVMTGDATDATLLGTTYRNAQQQLHQQLMTQLQTMTIQLGLAAAAASGPLTIPVVGGAMAGPIIGPALLQCVTAVTQMAAAIQSFEAQAQQYLSQKNKSD